jgi:hypothetical protein
MIETLTQSPEEILASIQSERAAVMAEREALESDKQSFAHIQGEHEAMKARMEAMEVREASLVKIREGELIHIQKVHAEVNHAIEQQKALEKRNLEIFNDIQTNSVKVHEANKQSESLVKETLKARDEAEDRRLAAVADISMASHAQEMAKTLTAIFRNALNSHIQIQGTGVKIPEITDEHRRFIAADLLSQCSPREIPEQVTDGKVESLAKEFDEAKEIEVILAKQAESLVPTSTSEPEAETAPEVETTVEPTEPILPEGKNDPEESIPPTEVNDTEANDPETPESSSDDKETVRALREEYEKKLGKKPFNGWSAAELTTHLNS